MKAPDKIYIHYKNTPLEITFSEEKEKDVVNIEYIRTEALLEWAKDVRETAKDNMDIRLAMEMVMSKIELL